VGASALLLLSTAPALDALLQAVKDARYAPQSDPRDIRTPQPRGGRRIVTGNNEGAAEYPRSPLEIGAADRIRTGDVQLGKLAFCH
jgi:hypothetical protein